MGQHPRRVPLDLGGKPGVVLALGGGAGTGVG